MLYQIGFGCRQEEDALRVGPFNSGDQLTPAQVSQMNHYMLRTWIEIELYLSEYQGRNCQCYLRSLDSWLIQTSCR